MENSEQQPKQKPKPLTDDSYWFKVALDMVDKGPDRIGESAARFEKLILWLWGIYTPLIGLGGSILSLALDVQFDVSSIVFLVLPSFVLLFGYWAATMAESSVMTEFDPREVADIKKAYNLTIQTRAKYFRCSQFLTGIACGLIPIAILVTQLDKKQELKFRTSISSDQKKIIVQIDNPHSKTIGIGQGDAIIETFSKNNFYKEIILTEPRTPIFIEYENNGRRLRMYE